MKKHLKKSTLRAILGCFFVILGLFSVVNGGIISAQSVSAVENAETTTVDSGQDNGEANTTDNDSAPDYADGSNSLTGTGGKKSDDNASKDNCKSSLGAIGWLVCPATGKIAEAVDFLYDKIESLLVIQPISAESGSPIYEIWKYCRGITNIVFIIFLLVVIYSQITGLGISNYGIKKALPKLIVAAVLINLSFLICSLGVEISNVIGNGLRGIFTSVQDTVAITRADVSYGGLFGVLAGGGAVLGVLALNPADIWLLIPVVLGAIVAVVTGLITIALRQAVVALLIMVSPLAFVTFILPNVDGWFKKWKDLFIKMLEFYPLFSLLFGASALAGYALLASAKTGFGVLLGVAVQVFPLIFSWKLMTMSGTVLGTINSKMRGFADRNIVDKSRDFANAQRNRALVAGLVNGKSPNNHLRRFMSKKQALKEKDTENLEALHRNRMNVYVQRKIAGGYDGTKAEGTSGYLKANKYTRHAKDLANSNLASETAEMDTKHVLNNYGSYFVDRDVRRRAEVAEKEGHKELAKSIRLEDTEARRADTGANNFLEYGRAKITADNDDEADLNFLVDQFLGANLNKEKNPESLAAYRHYIKSSAGGLGDEGQTRVLGRILAHAAAVESSQRRDAHIIAEKFPHMKSTFRNFCAKYYIDDDGYATDKEGNRLPGEKYRGYLLEHHPEQLVPWDQIDEKGRAYYDWYDGNNYVTRIYETDRPAIKELLSNYDAPINDPVNNLYGILAGIEPGSIKLSEDVERRYREQGMSEEDIKKKKDDLARIGLRGYRTTIGRALLNAPFKEKNAAFSPMVKEMIANGYIQNYAQENLAYLDSLNKATKPGNFLVQDGDAIEMFIRMMDPDRWEEVFPTELIRNYRNVNGEQIYGVRYGADGSREIIPAEEATREDLMNRVKEKFIIPAAQKITRIMSKSPTPNVMENQKPGTLSRWQELADIFDSKWGEESVVGVNPYIQPADMKEISGDMRHRIDNANDRHSSSDGASSSRRTTTPNASTVNRHVNHHAQVEEMHIFSNGDPNVFASSFVEYCNSYPELGRVVRDFQEFVDGREYVLTEEEMYEFAIELLDSYTNLD